MSKSRLLLKTDDKIMGYAYSAPVHTGDHGPLCFIADTELTARQIMSKGSYLYTLHEVSNWGGRTPRGTLRGPQVEPKF